MDLFTRAWEMGKKVPEKIDLTWAKTCALKTYDLSKDSALLAWDYGGISKGVDLGKYYGGKVWGVARDNSVTATVRWPAGVRPADLASLFGVTAGGLGYNDLIWGLTKTYNDLSIIVSNEGAKLLWDTSKDCGNKALDLGKYCGGKLKDYKAEIGGLACAAAGIKGTAALVSLIGFTAEGVKAGSTAAAWQSYLGNVAPGSLFSTLQSYAVTGIPVGPAVVLVVVVCVVTGIVVYVVLKSREQGQGVVDPVLNYVPTFHVHVPKYFPSGGWNCGPQYCSKPLLEMVKMNDDLFLFKAER